MLLTFFLMAAASAKPPQRTNDSALADANSAFCLDLYRGFAASEGNLFFSPYSISTAMAMVYGGANGDTADEIARALHFTLKEDTLHKTFETLGETLTASARDGGMKLSIANGLCFTGGGVGTTYKSFLKERYDAEIFGSGLSSVNNWVKKKTEGRIEKILEKLSPNSVCVILNAIYFKGTWETQFKKERTSDAPFKVSSRKKVTCRLMSQKGRFRLLLKKNFNAVSLPYRGGEYSMVVFLPHKADGIATLEKQLISRNLKRWFYELETRPKQKAVVMLPKYRMSTSYDLKPPLKKLGISDAFIPAEADFSGMGWGKGDLWIAQVKHKAFLEVNEEGTEAAGATAVEMQTKSAPRPPMVFRADHPFVFMIRHNKTGAVLFAGRLRDPEQLKQE